MTVRQAQRTQHGSWTQRWTPELVAECKDPEWAYAAYCCQLMGIPKPTVKDMATMRSKIRALRDEYPNCSWFTLCRLAQWVKRKKRRVSRVFMVVDKFRDAWADGALPELDRQVDEDVARLILEGLETEERPKWRARLLLASGSEDPRALYEEWLASR